MTWHDIEKHSNFAKLKMRRNGFANQKIKTDISENIIQRTTHHGVVRMAKNTSLLHGILQSEAVKMKKTTYNKLVKIANEHIPELNNRPTLEAMNSDHLDFFETSVWSLEKALIAAYELGKKDGERHEKV